MLNLYTFLLLPTYTLLFAGSEKWFSTNFSVRAVLGLGHFRGFVGWAAVAGTYFFVMMTRLTLTFEERWLRWLLHVLILTACISLGYAVLIPYLPEDIPRWASLHVALAAGAAVLQMAALLVMLLRLRAWLLLWVWAGVAAVCGLLFVTAGMVTTALEVFFTISAALLTRSLWLHRKNRPIPRQE